MSAILSPWIVQLAGGVIVVAVVVQVAVMTVSALGRAAFERESQRLLLDRLRHRTDLALVDSERERDRAAYSWNGLRKFKVAWKTREVEGVHSFYLKPHDGKPLPPYLPSQYLTFQLRVPGVDKPLVRCYSLSDSPADADACRVTVKKILRGPDAPDAPPGLCSTYFNDHVRVGDILDVKAPSGNFVLSTTKTTPVVLIAGGIGITPVLSMLNAVCDSGLKREVWFFLGVRNGSEHLMRDQLQRIQQEYKNIQVRVCYSQPAGDDEQDRDYDYEGFVGVDLFKELLPSNNYEFYVCDPPAMMSAITAGLEDWGVPPEDVHFEAFGPATVKKLEPGAGVSEGAESGLSIEFQRTGKTIAWDAKFTDLLDLAEANGIVIDSGCRAGNCGTCITAIKSGDVTYVTEPGAPPEDGSCFTCVAVPRTDLVLDA